MDSEENICAVSCDGNNVVYYKNKMSGARTQVKATEKISAIDITGSVSIKTLELTDSKNKMPYEGIDSNSVNLHINPVSSDYMNVSENKRYQQQLLFSVKKSKRLDVMTCTKEGLFVDDNEIICNDSYKDTNLETIVFQNSIENVNYDVKTKKNDQEEINIFILELIDELITNAVKESNLVICKVKSNDSIVEFANVLGTNIKHTLLSDYFVNGNTEADFCLCKAGEIYAHILIYRKKYEFQQIIFALDCIKTLLGGLSKASVTYLVTTQIEYCGLLRNREIMSLLYRHENAVLGESFFTEHNISSFQHVKLLEMIISQCLHIISGYFFKNFSGNINDQDIEDNNNVKISACDVLIELIIDLTSLISNCEEYIAVYIKDICKKCNLQEIVLQSIVINFCQDSAVGDSHSSLRFDFIKNLIFTHSSNSNNSIFNNLQMKLMNLCLHIVLLEDCLMNRQILSCNYRFRSDWHCVQPLETSFVQDVPLIFQPMLANIILWVLKQPIWIGSHKYLLKFLVSLLLHLRNIMGEIVIPVILQICQNFCTVAHPNTEYKS